MVLKERRSGVLLHISTLASKYGIGTLGEEAYKFVDFLDETCQSYWQVLPIGPTGSDNSPYSCIYSYGGNPYFIDLDLLTKEGLLGVKDKGGIEANNANAKEVDYSYLEASRIDILKKAYENFDTKDQDFLDFVDSNSWVQEYCLYQAIKEDQDGLAWYKWEDKYKFRDAKTLKDYGQKNLDRMNFWAFVQYQFHIQWASLRSYAKEKNIQIIGDLPIYVAMDSVDVWANPDLFKLDEDLYPRVVSGVPPDYFSEYGQLWNNPIYDWEKMEEDNFKWWLDRLDYQFEIFDIVRIDHFRAFEAFWQVDYPAKDAKGGKWIKAPGDKLLRTIQNSYKDLPIIAEDLGHITKEVEDLRNDFSIAGMAILQFAFDPGMDSSYLPHNLEKNTVYYSGTHDNNTSIGWLNDPSNQVQASLCKSYLGLDWYEGYNWGMIRGLMTSVANTVIVQAQDILGLGSEARMNIPSTVGHNWIWRMESGEFKELTKGKLKYLTQISGRENK